MRAARAGNGRNQIARKRIARVVAGLEHDKKCRVGEGSALMNGIAIQNLRDAVCRVRCQLHQHVVHLLFGRMIAGIVQHDGRHAARHPRLSLPGADLRCLRYGIHRALDQSSLDKRDGQVHVMRNVHEAVIGNNDHDGRWVVGELLVRQPLHHAVESFEVGAGFGAEGSVIVLRIVERAQVQGHEGGLVAFQDFQRVAGLRLVAADAGVVAIHVRPGGGLQLLHQRIGTRQRRHHQLVTGIRRAVDVRAAPKLRDEVIHACRADTYRPTHAGRAQPGLVRHLPQRRHANISRIPVPRASEFLKGVERLIVDDAVLAGPDAGDKRGVAGISDGGPDAHYAFRIGAFRKQGAQVRQLHAVRVGLGNIFGLEPVNRDHQYWRSVRGRRGVRGGCHEQENRPRPEKS